MPSVGVSVVFPWRGGCVYREAAFEWLRAAYAAQRPGWSQVVAPGPEPWVKAAALTPAIEALPEGEVVVVSDADVWCDVGEAVSAVQDGAAWAVPHAGVFRLDRQSTADLIAGGEPGELAQLPYRGLLGGGIVVLRRETYLDCPMDPRFVGWGQEDESWGLALEALHGTRWRGQERLIHLWHPAPPRLSRRNGSRQSLQLRRRYGMAAADPVQMRELIEEVKEPCSPA